MSQISIHFYCTKICVIFPPLFVEIYTFFDPHRFFPVPRKPLHWLPPRLRSPRHASWEYRPCSHNQRSFPLPAHRLPFPAPLPDVLTQAVLGHPRHKNPLLMPWRLSYNPSAATDALSLHTTPLWKDRSKESERPFPC